MHSLCCVLLGGEEVFDSLPLRFFPSSWVQLLVAKLRYTEPLVKIFDLQYEADVSPFTLASLSPRETIPSTPRNRVGSSPGAHTCACGYATQWAIRKFAQRAHWEPLPNDALLKAVMSMDDDQLLRDTSERFDWWFPAHLCDLLTACGAINKPERREALLMGYGTALFSHESLWAVGATYIASCPTMGADSLEVLLEQVPLDSDRKALKVIQLCEKHRLGDLRMCLRH